MERLTERQEDVFAFVCDKIMNRGYGPTVREIGEFFGIKSPNGVVCHLRALEKKGLLSRAKDKARGIELTEAARLQLRGMPMAGVVAAGNLSLALEQEERIDFTEMFSGDDRFALKVSGDSMIEAHIADGDYVVVSRRENAEPGQMVVAQTDDGEATVKYWFPEGRRIRLQPANSSMQPIYVREAYVIGVVVGVVRNFR